MKKFLLALGFLSFALSGQSQYNWEYGLHFGGGNYLGDIGGKELLRRTSIQDIHMNETNFTIGFYSRFKVNKRLSLHSSINYIPVEDRDANSTNPARRARNLNFRNRLVEFSTRAEVTIFYDNDVGNRGYYNPTFKMYVFAGLGGVYHNPQGQIFEDGVLKDDTWHDLRPWKTENEDYSKVALAVPFGVGFAMTGNKIWRFGIDLSYRYTFTDYIDDISTDYANPDRDGDGTLSDDELLIESFASQTYQGLIDQINQEGWDPESNGPGSVYDHQWNTNDIDAAGKGSVKRGDPTHNDNYVTATVSIGYVLKGRSQFYKKKYSWLKQRAAARRSRAKF